MKTRRSFTPEFKREAVSLFLDQGYKVSDVCGQFDLGQNMLRLWASLAPATTRTDSASEDLM